MISTDRIFVKIIMLWVQIHTDLQCSDPNG